MKQNPALAIIAYVLIVFAVIVIGVKTPSIQFYIGGIVIALFMLGLFFAFGNTIRQGKRMADKQSQSARARNGSSHTG